MGFQRDNAAQDGAPKFGEVPYGNFSHGGSGAFPGGPIGDGGCKDVENNELYDILGVQKDATTKEIRKAYFDLSREHHPDKGGDEERYKEINSAYEVLKDDDLRMKYDKYGIGGVNGDANSPQGEAGADLFQEIFGGSRGRNRRTRGPNVNYPLKVGLEDLYKGKTTKIAINRKIIVGEAKECDECQGSGSKVDFRELGPGMVTQVQRPCGECKGKGYLAETSPERKVVEVYIERGMMDGQKITLRNMADEVPNMEPGDVNIIVTEKDHKLFRRKGADLLLTKELSINQALCGFSFKIAHLDGRQILIRSKPGEVIRPQTQSQPFVKVLRNEGMPSQGNPFVRGDLYVLFVVRFPEDNEFDHDAIKTLREVLPDADTEEEYDAEEVEEVTLSPGSVLDFGMGGEPSAGGDAYDSDEEGGAPQCQQS